MTPLERSAGVPQHLAVVMDGNGRWAKQRYLPRLAGHRQGLEKLRELVRWCGEAGVQVLTVFAFSSENWSRPADEVSGLMGLLGRALEREVAELERAGVRLHFPGDRQALSPELQQRLAQAERQTAANQRLVLNVCFNYGGRWDVVQAAQQLAARGEPITEAALTGAMALAHVGDPDLLIRTGGEQRLSNFLLWQSAYSELYFSAALWPAFEREEFDRALAAYARRERRFGLISEQMAEQRSESVQPLRAVA
ncbi:polyprenyl diphosphate synthase [Serpentinimonas barnesii]|uniref:polyprenyl diphosphate synthase n=1 Tax=Serpentinimonas barnesii TaxID=1458427 RepID=UPI0004964018|nr:polyprenyl diphosphate synthase [Serpentinimonas barnesii]